jgi:hypothetical protein
MTEQQKARLAELRADKRLSALEKKELADLEQAEAIAKAEAMEKDNASIAATEGGTGGDVVYVLANLETGQSFRLSGGRTVTIEGMPVSNLKKPDGGFFPGGKYGVTKVDAAAWAEIVKTYGKMKMFVNKLVFAAPTLERGKAMARELGGLRHGLEPVDPNSSRVKSSPHSVE